MNGTNGHSSGWRPAASILREMLADKDNMVVCPGVYDGLTARIALKEGFDCLYMTGAGTTASVLGLPDLALVTQTEMHVNASMIASIASSCAPSSHQSHRPVPVIADADTGFGSPLNVSRTVSLYIHSNVAALHLEDQTLAKRCGHLAGKTLVSTDEFVSRIRAAVLTRESMGRDIVIIARTDALQSFGYDEAIRRLKAAVAAGADVAFLEGFTSAEQGRQACADLAPTPVLCNMVAGGVTPDLNVAEVKALGFRILILPCFALTPVYNAVTKAAKRLRETGDVEKVEGGKGGVRDIFGICGLDECVEFDGLAGGMGYQKGV